MVFNVWMAPCGCTILELVKLMNYLEIQTNLVTRISKEHSIPLLQHELLNDVSILKKLFDKNSYIHNYPHQRLYQSEQ